MSCLAMLKKMKPLISSVLLVIVSICTGMRLAVADPETSTVWSVCGSSGKNEYRNGSAFQLNLNKVLESLVRNVYPSGFNTSSIVGEGVNSNSTVYGLVQCRGDLDPSDCKQCVSTAKAKLVEAGCQNTSGFIQLDGCFLRYDNHNFYNDIEGRKSPPAIVLCNTENSSQPQQFTNAVEALLSNVTAQASQSPKLFAADSAAAPSNITQTMYSLAQCWRDLSRTSCGSCLTEALSKIFRCQSGALGAQFGSQNCYLRYEIYVFFDTSVLLPPPPVSSEGKKTRAFGMTLGVVTGGTLGLIAAILTLRWNCFSSVKRPEQNSRTTGPTITGETVESILSNSELSFKYEILREATSNFNAKNKLGEGGFGSVFKGVLPNGREVAVKRLYMGSRQGDAEFLNEANLISRVQHRNLVKLLGCCIESSERLLVYEYHENNSLEKILFDTTNQHHILDWKERFEIMVGTARGLAYLHDESEIRIIHRDIKTSNILLDDKYRPKIADFGLARFFAEDQSHFSTNVVGTLGYMAPEYALHGQLTEKVDVFGFGVLVLEIISGRKCRSLAHEMEFLIEGTWRLYEAERALEVIDTTLQGSYSWEEAARVIKIGLLCTQAAAALRPSMFQVVWMLIGLLCTQAAAALRPSMFQVVWMLTGEQEHISSPTRPAFIDL